MGVHGEEPHVLGVPARRAYQIMCRHKLARRRLLYHMERVEDTVVYFD